ncbi:MULTISPECIES: S53 family peptidase [unclassified Frankia]|uniref:S53 family peptidase n=1 Tax=unclassified Frankia TaxID=2632575 RepID=UPI002AD31929|nr:MULTISPECIES: S53 family peptidase [unclassified Frankia]
MIRQRVPRSVAVFVALVAMTAVTVPAVGTDAAPRWLRALLAGPAAIWPNDGGDVPGGQDVQVTVYLALRDPAGAETAATAVSDPANASYRHFLTQNQFKASYAATDDTVNDIRGWLIRQGFDIVSMSSTNRSIRVHGSVAAFEATFDTDIRTYTHDGTEVHAPSRTPSVPVGFAGAILSIGALTIDTATDHTPAPPLPVFVRPPTCSSYHGEKYPADYPVIDSVPRTGGVPPPLAVCGYSPSQVRSLYGIDDLTHNGLDGRGTTVAILGSYASPTIMGDVNTWATRQGEPPFKPGQFRQYFPPDFFFGHNAAVSAGVCKEQVSYSEETLDVEAVHGMAPGADIAYVGAASCQLSDMTDALQRIVDEHLADVVSGTYSFLENEIPTGDVNAAHSTFLQAALQGIGIFFSTGDHGDNLEIKKVRGVVYPASDPFVTAVGGTSAGISQNGSRLFEFGWETATTTQTDGSWTPPPPGTFLAGGGGGVSKLFTQPRYQTGLVPFPISEYFTSKPGRTLPDVAALGDPNTGYLVGQTETSSDGTTKYIEYRLGGTSLATPLFAGITALTNQLTGHPTGFANYALYRMANTPAYYDPSSSNRATAVVDVYYTNNENPTDGYKTELRTLNQKQTIYLRTGYDDVTGLGTPNGLAFIVGLAHTPDPP